MGTDIEVHTTVFDSDTLLVDIDMKNGSFVDGNFSFQRIFHVGNPSGT